MAWIQSATGHAIRILEPSPEQVRIEDIAHALANVCRFGGHSREHYSVAQHSVIVAGACPQALQLVGLLHDAAEAYLGDIVTPLKRTPRMAEAYLGLEDEWALAIGRRFGLGAQLTASQLPVEVKLADMRALVTEKRDLLEPMPGVPVHEWLHVGEGRVPEPFPNRINAWSQSTARGAFMTRFHQFMRGR